MAFLILIMIIVSMVMIIATKKDMQRNDWGSPRKDRGSNDRNYPPPKTE